MGGIFGVASKSSCVLDLFLELIITLIWEPEEVEWLFMIRKRDLTGQYITSKTRLFSTKFDRDVSELQGCLGIGCISDNEPQPLLVQVSSGKFCHYYSR